MAASENAPASKPPASKTQALFAAATAAYQHLKACDLHLAHTPRTAGHTQDATLAWRLPDRTRLSLVASADTTADTAPLAQTVCDGTFQHDFSLSSPRAKATASSTASPPVRYRKRPLLPPSDAPDAPPLVSALRRHQTLLGGEALPLLVAGENPLTRWEAAGRVVSVADGGVGLVNGIPVERVVVVLRNEGVTGDGSGAISGQNVGRLPVPPPAPVAASPSAPQPLPALPQPVPTTATTRAMAARTAASQAAQNAVRLRQGVRPSSPSLPSGGRGAPSKTGEAAIPPMREDVVTLTLAFGQNDHLLRQSSETRAVWQNGRQAQVTSETSFTQIKINPVLPDALFVFVPPPGVVLPTDTTLGGSAGDNTALALYRRRRAALLRREHSEGSVPPPARPMPAPSTVPRPASPVPPPANASNAAKGTTLVEIGGGTGGDSGTPRMVSFAAGTISLLEQSLVRHVFLLRNTGSAPLTLGTLRPSCSCIHAAFAPATATEAASLAPGQEVRVEVMVDLDGLPSGPLRKAVSVYPAPAGKEAAPSVQPVAFLMVEGTIAPAITVTPPLLNFGPFPAGQPRSLVLTADIDARLLPQNGGVGDAGSVQLAPTDATLISASPIPAGESNGAQAVPPPAPGTVRRQFRVTVDAHAPLGSLMTRLRFVPPPGTSANSSAAWRSGTTPVVGLVLGDVSANPTRLDLGRIGQAAGTPSSQAKSPAVLATGQILLTGASEQAFIGMECVSSSPFLQAQLQPVGAAVASTPSAPPVAVAQRTLMVRLLSSAPAGAFSGEVTVRLRNGQQVTLPVTGYVREAVAGAAPQPNAK